MNKQLTPVFSIPFSPHRSYRSFIGQTDTFIEEILDSHGCAAYLYQKASKYQSNVEIKKSSSPKEKPIQRKTNTEVLKSRIQEKPNTQKVIKIRT